MFFLLLFLIPSFFFASSTESRVNLYLHTELSSLDPYTSTDRRTQTVLRQLFEGLFRIGKDGQIEPGVAKSVHFSSSTCSYTFSLKQSSWSNGDRVTAHDFVRGWKKAIDPSAANACAHLFFPIKNAQKAQQGLCSIEELGVCALDDQTFSVTLERPCPYFLELLSLPAFSPNPPASHNQYLIGNGPFTLKERKLGSHLLLQKNPLHEQAALIKIDEICFSIIEHPNTAYLLFSEGKLDWYGDPLGIIPLELIRSLPNLFNKSVGALYFLSCNTHIPPLDRPQMRAALSDAVHREELCHFLNGGELPTKHLLANTSYAPNTKPAPPRRLPASLTLSHWAEPASRVIAQLLQKQIYSTLGIRITLREYDWATYLQKLHNKDFELITATRYPIISDPQPQLEYLASSWNNTYFSQLLYQANLTPTKRTALLAEAAQLADKELPIIPLYRLAFKYAKAPGLQGEVISPTGAVDLRWLEWSRS